MSTNTEAKKPQQGPKSKLIRNPDTGEIMEVPVTPYDNTVSGALSDFLSPETLEASGLGVSKNTFTDTFAYKRGRFKMRYVGSETLLRYDNFVRHAVAELGLEELAAQMQDFSGAPNPDEARKQAALLLFDSQVFRVDHPDKSKRADELTNERYELLLLGVDPDSDNPAEWGGLVGWNIDGVSESQFPFTPENVRKLDLKTKAVLAGRLLSLTREGTLDAQFRRVIGL